MLNPSPEYHAIKCLAVEGATFNEVPVDLLVSLALEGYDVSALENLFTN